MFKLLVTGALVYFIYRFFIAPPAIEPEQERKQPIEPDPPRKQTNHDDEYIDYEEVE